MAAPPPAWFLDALDELARLGLPEVDEHRREDMWGGWEERWSTDQPAEERITLSRAIAMYPGCVWRCGSLQATPTSASAPSALRQLRPADGARGATRPRGCRGRAGDDDGGDETQRARAIGERPASGSAGEWKLLDPRELAGHQQERPELAGVHRDVHAMRRHDAVELEAIGPRPRVRERRDVLAVRESD